MFENSIWISAIADEEIKNNSICVYHSHNKTLTNTKHRDEIATEVFVFIDQSAIYQDGKCIIPEIVKKGEYARCLRINISA